MGVEAALSLFLIYGMLRYEIVDDTLVYDYQDNGIYRNFLNLGSFQDKHA